MPHRDEMCAQESKQTCEKQTNWIKAYVTLSLKRHFLTCAEQGSFAKKENVMTNKKKMSFSCVFFKSTEGCKKH